MNAAFGHTEEMARLISRHGDLERARIGKPHVLARKADHPPRHIERIFARFEHARQPIDGGVGIGIAHGLMQRGDDVIVFLARLVI